MVGAKTGSQVERTHSKSAARGQGEQSHIGMQTSWGEPQGGGNSGGVRQTMKPRFSVQETKDSKPKAVKKSVGIVMAGETLSLIGEFVGETHGVLKYTHTHTHTPADHHLKGHELLVGRQGSGTRREQAALFPL